MIDSFASIAELRRGLTRKEFSSVELTEHYLTRLQTVGRRHRAVAEIMRERALSEARAADRRIAVGDSSPVLGVPYGERERRRRVPASTRPHTMGRRQQQRLRGGGGFRLRGIYIGQRNERQHHVP